jgi:signal transduction histidine kinase
VLEEAPKFIVLIISTFYVLLKLLQIKIKQKNILQYLLTLLFALAGSCALYECMSSLVYIFMVLLIMMFSVKRLGIPSNLAITSAVIAFGYSFLVFLISSIIICSIVAAFVGIIHNAFYTDLLTLVLIIPLQALLVTMTFRFKRLKKGMPFLIDHGSSDIGVYISMTLLVAASLLGMNEDSISIKIIPIVFILLSGLIILFWWRKSLTGKYLEKIKAQEIKALKDAVDEKDAEIQRLIRHNNELSKIIHRDNKLIPALELAVRQYLSISETETDPGVRRAKTKLLLSQIESQAMERSGIVKTYEMNSKALPSTDVLSVDALLGYMYQKAQEHRLDFSVSITGSVKYLIENVAGEQDVTTLLADLTENAIIAAKERTAGNIMVNIGIADNCYAIDVFDNGAPFSPETIAVLGLQRTTTHLGEGGSGIGLMTLFEIIGKYQASFVIADAFSNGLYTKKVSVCFDHMGQFRVHSKQGSYFKPLTARPDLALVKSVGA